MVRKQDIDKFYAHIDSLNLKFPVAAIAKATGYSKGNVSEYLNSRSASENFMRKVYKAFPLSSEIVPRETEMTTYSDTPSYQTKGIGDEKDRIIKEKDERIKELKEQLEFLKGLIKEKKEKS